MNWSAQARARYFAACMLVASLGCVIYFISPLKTQHRSLLSRHERGFALDGRVRASNHSLLARDDYSCSEDNPCSNHACCGKSGFCGYGPDYCGDGCQADCDAVAECGEFASEKGKKCPLNVCCSEFGFCGTTKDFCNAQCQSNCDSPSLPDGRSSSPVRDKVIVYYEAWYVWNLSIIRAELLAAPAFPSCKSDGSTDFADCCRIDHICFPRASRRGHSGYSSLLLHQELIFPQVCPP